MLLRDEQPAPPVRVPTAHEPAWKRGRASRRNAGARDGIPVPQAEQHVRRRAAAPADNLMMILDRCGRIRSCSPAAARLFGRGAAELVQLGVRALIPELPIRENTPGYNLSYAVFTFPAGAWQRFEGCDAIGRMFPIDVSIDTLTLEGKHGYFVSLRVPASDDECEIDMQRLIDVASASADAMLITDLEGRITYANPAFEALTHFNCAEVVGRTPRILKSGVQGPKFYTRMWAALQGGGEFNALVVNRRKNGETFHADESIRPFVDRFGNITHYVATLRDVSLRVRLHERLDYLANHDTLTGLPNRNLFEDRLQRELARCNRSSGGFTLLFLDVDGFKAINDQYGHAAGDKLLRTVGTRLKQCVRDSDTVARLGGDEFALILVGMTDRTSLDAVLDKIAAVGASVALGDMLISVSISAGVATFPDAGHDGESLLEAADSAMYRAKRAGRGLGAPMC